MRGLIGRQSSRYGKNGNATFCWAEERSASVTISRDDWLEVGQRESSGKKKKRMVTGGPGAASDEQFQT